MQMRLDVKLALIAGVVMTIAASLIVLVRVDRSGSDHARYAESTQLRSLEYIVGDQSARRSSSILGPPFPEAGSSIESWVGASEIVAEVAISRTGELLYNTPDGSVPTPTTGGGLGGMAQAHVMTVTLQISETMKPVGFLGQGFVVLEPGEYDSTVPDMPLPRYGLSTVGDQGIVFLTTFDQAVLNRMSTPMYIRVQDELDALGSDYQYVMVNNFYVFNGSRAYSVLDDRDLSIADLRQQIQGAMQP